MQATELQPAIEVRRATKSALQIQAEAANNQAKRQVTHKEPHSAGKRPSRASPPVVAAAAVAPVGHQLVVVLIVAHYAVAAGSHLEGSLHSAAQNKTTGQLSQGQQPRGARLWSMMVAAAALTLTL